MTLILLEIGVRIYAYSIGRGFFDNPQSFLSPFFTTDEIPAPYADGNDRVFKEGERVTVEKRPGEVRVVCFGGSTTLPAHDPEAYSYPHGLRDLLAERFPNATVTVLNAGGNGFSSAHTLVNLSLRVLEIQPDIITIYHNINDLSVNYFGKRATSDYGNKYLTSYYLGFRHRSGLWGALARVSRLARIATNRVELLQFGYEDYDTKRDYAVGSRFFRRNLESIVAVARAHEVDIVLGTQAARKGQREDPGFMLYNSIVRSVAHDANVPLAEVAERVVAESDFVDDVHYTSRGARAVAQVWNEPVAALVAKHLSTPSSASTPVPR
ncbi:MAG: hypothetical protein HY271_13760 [Deltaproteobacteria bacterium]|nr:hypothetical protein [Deltaproteobacteria bacterium]